MADLRRKHRYERPLTETENQAENDGTSFCLEETDPSEDEDTGHRATRL